MRTTQRRWSIPVGLCVLLPAALGLLGCSGVPAALPAAVNAAAARDETRVADTRLVGAAAVEAEDELAWQLLEHGHQRELREKAQQRLAAERRRREAALRAAVADPATPAEQLRGAAQALLDAPTEPVVSVAEVEALRERYSDAHEVREATRAEFQTRLDEAASGAPEALRAAVLRALEQLDDTRAAVRTLGGAAVEGVGTAIQASAAAKAAKRARKLQQEAADNAEENP